MFEPVIRTLTPEPPETRPARELAEEQLHELAGARIAEPGEGPPQSRGEVVVGRDREHGALESLERLALVARRPEQVVEVLPSGLARGVIERAEHGVEVEIPPRAIIDRGRARVLGAQVVVCGDRRHVLGPRAWAAPQRSHSSRCSATNASSASSG